VQNVSIELTTRMLATLFDFPYEKRHQLAHWSDIIAGSPQATGGPGSSNDEFYRAAIDMTKQFTELWHQKAAQKAAGVPMGYDVMSMLVYSKDTEDLIRKPMEFMGNLALADCRRQRHHA
jgi:cytochrome P450